MGKGVQNGGCCTAYDTVYCWEKSGECAAKSMTQNSKHNRCLSLLQASADSYLHALIFPWWLQLSERSLSVCLSVCVWAGVVQSLFIPGFQLTREVMVVTLSAGSALLNSFVLCCSFRDASGALMMVSDGMWPVLSLPHALL